MFFMKTKKRVKALEKQAAQLQKQYEQIKSNQNEIINDLSELSSLISNITSGMADNSDRPDSSENVNAILRKSISQLKSYVDTQIENNRKEQLSVNDVNEIVAKNNKQLINEINLILKKQEPAAAAVEVDYDRINRQIIQAVKQASGADNQIAQLNTLLYNEIKRNEQLEEQMQLIMQRLSRLEEKNTKLEEKNTQLEKKTRENVHSAPAEKTVINKPVLEKPAEPVNNPVSACTPLFSDNVLRNEKMLSKIIDNAAVLKEKYDNILEADGNNAVYFKTIDNCMKKLQRLSEKLSSTDMESSKIVGEIVKILNSTIVKNFAKKELYSAIDQFMIDSLFIKKELPIGKKLSDDDYDLIGDMPLDVPVDSMDQHNVIQGKEHDAYLIYYKDEEGLSYRVIDGKYSIGKYLKQG